MNAPRAVPTTSSGATAGTRSTLFSHGVEWTVVRAVVSSGPAAGWPSSSIRSRYTRNVNAAFRAMQDLDNGISYINAPTIGAEAHLPFGGVKQTGNGHREGGWEVYEFYSETKVCYVDYSGTLQRAQIDNYDD